MSKYIPAEEFCNLVADGTHDSPKKVEKGIPLVTSKNIVGGKLSLDKIYNISYLDADNINRRSKVDINDVLISMIGTVGEVCLIDKEPNFVIKNVGLFKCNNTYDAKWLYFYLCSSNAQQLIKERLRGTTQQYLSLGELRKLPILLPNTLEHQNQSVDILSFLDQKIELNTQTNQTLEQIAQAIFKSWFVDFDPVKAKRDVLANGGTPEQAELQAMQIISGKTADELKQMQHSNPERYKTLVETTALFPREMVESELGDIPKGWEVTNFGSVSECFDNQRVPLSKQQREKRKGNIPYYGATSVMDYVDEAIFDGVYLLMGEDGSVVQEDGTPFLQYIWGKSWVNNHAHVLQGKGKISTEQLMLFLKNTNISSFVTGAVQLKINQKNMNSIPFIKSTDNLNQKFYEKISMLYEKIKQNSDENKNLVEIRDTLLPKLLSGDINS